MFGWRARIGYLCPSVFEMIAYDFYRIVPPGVGLIGVTCMIDGWQAEAYRIGLARLAECATELGRRNVYAAARQAVKQSPQIDGLHLPCPQFPALEVINEIESDLRLPAVGHLTSEIWMAFKTLKIRTPIQRFGKLLTMM